MKPNQGISTLNRQETLRRLPEQTFDVLVIGGGIMGAGIALDAAARGLNVLLVEKQDFAAGTSSRSTKLIHGGLRYLKNLECLLVRGVARERQVLHRNAPHLVIPEPMLIPVLRQNSFGYWPTAAGLTLYELLGNVAAPERHQMLNIAATLQQEPLLNPDGLKGSGLFYEYRTDDARLTLEVLKTAAAYGATCLNYTNLKEFAYQGAQLRGAVLEDVQTKEVYRIRARCLINATGPWSALLMQQDQQTGGPNLYHTKGVHLVIPREKLPLRQSVYFDIAGGRMLFAIPRHNVTYLGTTDTPFTGKLENPVTTFEDATYLLDQINRMFPSAALTLEDVESSWAGVRALLFEEGKKPSEISRKDALYVSPAGLITVAGGKLTGYRKLAEQVIDKAIKLHFPQIRVSSPTASLPLSGGNFGSQDAIENFLQACTEQLADMNLPPEQAAYLVQNYGANATEILQKTRALYETGQPPATCLLQAEIWYAVSNESAATISDFLIRRTGRLYFGRPNIESILPDVIKGFQRLLQLNEQDLNQQEAEFLKHYNEAIAFRVQPVPALGQEKQKQPNKK